MTDCDIIGDLIKMSEDMSGDLNVLGLNQHDFFQNHRGGSHDDKRGRGELGQFFCRNTTLNHPLELR